ncbi:protein kinase domain-containing protein [uncultured Catenibacterium sp.]|uniref:protein kinase domain-containing protein n=1 Tax=uncultured Catenibacterium sp. TaxID=286142 RepID=UPI0026374871|nr:hypothetical protein [uncultured Catenibacterium sp.]
MIYYGRNHKIYDLGQRLGGGGEGEIYDIVGNPSLVAKIYFNSKFNPVPGNSNPRKNLKEKIETMLEQPVQPYVNGVLTVAWPQDLLLNQQGQFVGYVMPRVKSTHHIFAASRERERMQLYPHYTWKTSIAIAYNLSLAVKIIHQSNAVVGDMNPNNIMIDEHGHVTIIDTDSFNITNKNTSKVYKCSVGISEMLAPELQGKNLADPRSVFNEKTDDFSLAIHICTLLMNNCHPFGCTSFNISQSSTSTNPVVYNILRGNCPYVTNAKGKASPDSPDVKMLPKDIRDLFDRAFNYTSSTAIKSSTIRKRPSAREWQNALGKLLNSNMKTCKKLYPEVHVYPASYHKCPWCAIKSKVPSKNININQLSQSWKLWLVCILSGLVFSPFLAKYFIPICIKLCGTSFELTTARIILAIVGSITGAIIAFYAQKHYIKSGYEYTWLSLGLLVPFATVVSSSLVVVCGFLAVYVAEIIMNVCIIILIFTILFGIFS